MMSDRLKYALHSFSVSYFSSLIVCPIVILKLPYTLGRVVLRTKDQTFDKLSAFCNISELETKENKAIITRGVGRNFLEGGSNSSKLSATMVERQKKFRVTERLKR